MGRSPCPYAEVARVAPYAVNVQVKTEVRRKGKSKEPADLARVIRILREAKYSGYVVLEYNAPEDAMTAVPRYVKTLRSLIAEGAPAATDAATGGARR
jgi:hypothetical protein